MTAHTTSNSVRLFVHRNRTGVSRNASPNHAITTGFRPHADDGSLLPPEETPLVMALRERRPCHQRLNITGIDGVDRSIEVTAFPLEGGRGRLIGAVAMFWEQGQP